MEKICAHCENNLDILFFYKHKSSKDGLGSWCKICLKNRSAEKRRESGIAPRRVGIDLEKQRIRSKKYKEKTFYEIPEDLKFQKCLKCNETKDINFFRKRSDYINGLSKHCKSCNYKGSKNSRNTYELKNWAKRLLSHAKKHSKTVVEIDEQYILDLYEKQSGKCFWFGVNLEPSNISKYPWQPSLDRLNTNIGYEPGNVVLACYTANIGRNTSTAEIFKKFVEDLKNSLKEK
jgi:hypothetical protein